ncbi:MAG: PH domain-containing protein [Gemmatimonadales bacterium]
MAYQASSVVYPSKRDWWLVLLLWAAAIGMGAAAVGLWVDPAPLGLRAGLTPVLAVVAVLTLWILYSTRYSFERDRLVVRSGPFRWRVDLDSIVEVVPTRNPLSSPACSLDRLRIRYGSSRMGIMISPENKAAFLRDLVARVPGLELVGDTVARKPVD